MPKQTGKSAFLAKYGDKLAKAHAEHKDEPTTFDTAGRLPAGIEGGVARLTDVKIGQYQKGNMKGEYFFYASGAVVEPKTFEGQRIEGRTTSIMEPLCDTPSRVRKTLSDHYGWVLNELRKLGVETGDLKHDDLDAVIEALKQEKPYFTFRTWKGDKATTGPYAGKEPMTNEVWGGLAKGFTPDSSDSGVEDNTSAEPEETYEPESEPEQPQSDGEADVDDLARRADEGDSDAAADLNTIAVEAGIPPSVINTAKDWATVARMVAEARSSGEPAAEQEEQPFTVTKGEVVQYRPVDPKTKKVAKNPVHCDVTAVYVKSRTADLKSLVDGKTVYKEVSWDLLKDEK